MATILKVQKNLDKLISALSPHYEFFSIQMVPWLCENLWDKFVPEEIRNEIKCKEDVRTAIDLFFQQNSPPEELIKKHPALHKHIEHQKSFFLENLDDKLYLTENELLEEFKRLKIPIQTGLSFDIKEWMSEKKCHEVEVASSIVGEFCFTFNFVPKKLSFVPLSSLFHLKFEFAWNRMENEIHIFIL